MSEALKEFFSFVLIDGALLVGLFFSVTFLIALAQQQSGVQKLIQRLENTPLLRGSIYATLFGAITPFCSCSTVPLVQGMLRTRIRFGIAMVFLMASPLVSESVIIVMARYFGLRYTVMFVVLAMILPIIGGITIHLMRFEKYVKMPRTTSDEIPGKVVNPDGPAHIPWRARFKLAYITAKIELRALIFYLLIGLAIGGAIHGFVPEAWITKVSSTVGTPLMIPLLAVLGGALYFNMPAAVPVAFALTEKGVNIGAVIAFLVAGGGMSIPELILLSKMFKRPLLVAYIVTMLSMAILMGYLFAYVF